MRFIDLFCGIGGFHVALQHHGHCVFASDIDAKCRDAYEANFAMTPAGDITAINAADIPAHDVLCAGFPCQSFSQAGNRQGMRDERGRLFQEIVRVAAYHKPRLLLLENVPAILSLDGGVAAQAIVSELAAIGYETAIHTLNASHYGIPQSRKRVYFVATRGGMTLSQPPVPTNEAVCVRDVMDGRHDDDERLAVNPRHKITWRDCDEGGRGGIMIAGTMLDGKQGRVIYHPEGHSPSMTTKNFHYGLYAKNHPIEVATLKGGRQGERIYSDMGHAVTQSASSGGVGKRTGLYATNGKIRRLHIEEAKQVMGFDKNHFVADGLAGYSQLGNAVIPHMVDIVYRSAH